MSTRPLVHENTENPSANIGEEIRRELEKRGLRAPSTDNLIEEIKRMKAEIAASETEDLTSTDHETEMADEAKSEPIYTADGKGELVGFRSNDPTPDSTNESMKDDEDLKLAAIEEELREKSAENGEDSTGNLLADASHELRSPLQAITGFLELLQSGKVSNAQEAKHFLKIAYSESQYLTNRVADLEVASLIATGLFRLKSDPVLVNQVIKSCAQLYELHEESKQILLKADHFEDLPTFFGDELRIRHALSNIIELVAASVKPGGSVVITAGVEDDSLWIGIEPKGVLESGRLRTSSQTNNGSIGGGISKGLSVFVSKHIIEAHGGELTIQGSDGKFVSYRIVLPLSLEKKSKGTILITEDNPHTGLLLEFALENEGFVPIRATNGSEALCIMTETQVDLIILDAVLPGMDGFELCQRVRSSPETASIPIIMASAKAQEEYQAKALGLGANVYFQKPLSLSSLIPIVEKLIQENRDPTILDTITSSREG
jgi:CheY-like chemotaxis protein/signal transduction histidine kinase